jgi:methylthioxylose transferase
VTTAIVERTRRARADDGGRTPTARPGLVAIGAAAVLVVVVHVWGRWLQARGHELFINLPPLVGHVDLRQAWQAVAAPALGVAAVVWGRRLSVGLSWRHLLWLAFAAAAAWAIALALTEGVAGFLRSPSGQRDYLHDVPLIDSPLTFLRTYVDEIDRYATHVRAHPPGMVLLAWTVARAGGGPAWLGAIEVAGAASAVPAALLTLRALSGEERARAAAPFLALAPAAITMASSGDAFFTGVGAWAVALVVLAIVRGGRRGDALAIGGGVLFSVVAFLSYGLVLLAVIPVVVATARHRWRSIGIAALGAVPVFLILLAAGFWWVEGLLATRVEYLESVARSRPYWYFLVANVGAFCLILGPATIAGTAMLRTRSTWLLVGGALLAVALADLSGMSKAETERIWLPFAPWVLLATSALPRPSLRTWIAANVAFGLALELAVRQPW